MPNTQCFTKKNTFMILTFAYKYLQYNIHNFQIPVFFSLHISPQKNIVNLSYLYFTDLSKTERAKLLLSLLVKTILLLVFVYFFICALGFLTDAFQLLGGIDSVYNRLSQNP